MSNLLEQFIEEMENKPPNHLFGVPDTPYDQSELYEFVEALHKEFSEDKLDYLTAMVDVVLVPLFTAVNSIGISEDIDRGVLLCTAIQLLDLKHEVNDDLKYKALLCVISLIIFKVMHEAGLVDECDHGESEEAI